MTRPYIEMAQSYGFPEKAYRQPLCLPALDDPVHDHHRPPLGLRGHAGQRVSRRGGLRLAGPLALRRGGYPAQGPERHRRHRCCAISALFLIVNIIVDLVTAYLNPRIRHSQRALTMQRTLYILLRKPDVRCWAWSSSSPWYSVPSSPISSRPYPAHRGAVVDFANFNRAPEWPYIFGTDLVGRDIFSRILLRLPHLAPAGRGGAGHRRPDRRHDRARGRLSGRLDGICTDARDRRLPVDPAAGAGQCRSWACWSRR